MQQWKWRKILNAVLLVLDQKYQFKVKNDLIEFGKVPRNIFQ